MKPCEGCHAKCVHYVKHVQHIKHKRSDVRMNVILDCPCIKCLIKVVCSVECPEYSTFFKRTVRTIQMK